MSRRTCRVILTPKYEQPARATSVVMTTSCFHGARGQASRLNAAGALRLGLVGDALEALRTDAVCRMSDELFRDPRLAAADCFEPEPLVPDFEPAAPGAVEEQRALGAGFAQHP